MTSGDEDAVVAPQATAAQSSTQDYNVSRPDTDAAADGLTDPPMQHEAFGHLVVDSDPDRDSALGDSDGASFTTSLDSSVTNYKYEHGRRYHAYQDGKYVLPNDEAEINRLDLSPIQPTMVPSNVTFIVDDITGEWLYPGKFDYIHSRAITVGVRDWGALVEQIWKNLRPGGWIEFQEYHFPFTSDDDTIKLCPALEQWSNNTASASAKMGMRLDAILAVPDVLKAKGFVNIGKAATKWPLGPWAQGKKEKKLGELLERDLLSALEGASMRLYTKVLGWSEEAVRKHVGEVQEDIQRRKAHAYIPIDFLWAQKPAD
ncbi:hypothetical protein B0A50_07636 [Salinomyces thailandicus]|uniref:TAM domain methyltransferase n=1 Tax=Salinomyces thailandicus TaxID=706561 RepID=A0A4U0TLC5_9PEZI|nr:hypothetical protein B0A50_07636 [Salinomyces thailandica]